MKIAYAFRRCTFYPNQVADLPSESVAQRQFFEKVKSIGFDGVELTEISDITHFWYFRKAVWQATC